MGSTLHMHVHNTFPMARVRARTSKLSIVNERS